MDETMAVGLTEDCIRIRREVFIKEQGFLEEFDDIDPVCRHIVLYDGAEPAATGRLYPDEDNPGVWHIGRVAVRKLWRGRHWGSRVMENLEENARALGAQSAVLSAQTTARVFYEKLGYTAVGEEYNEEGHPHVTMVKTLSD